MISELEYTAPPDPPTECERCGEQLDKDGVCAACLSEFREHLEDR